MDNEDVEVRKRGLHYFHNSEMKRHCPPEISNLGEEHDTSGRISTRFDPKVFTAVASRISDEKILVIEELGFGPVHQLRCKELNLACCKMLENFNIDRCTIKIHGRILTITDNDFDMLSRLRCRGKIVSLPKRLIYNPELEELESKIWDVHKEMSIDTLRRNVVFSDHPDDLFEINFVLPAMATMYYPTGSGSIDPRLLSLVKDGNCLRFAFTKLLEEVKSYQNNKPCLEIGGCLVFLQLFYLDVIAERISINPTNVPPVVTRGRRESNTIYEKLEEKGGFYCTEGIWVTKRHSGVRSSQFSGSRDYNTGLKMNLVDDMSAILTHISSVAEKAGTFQNIVYHADANISNMLDAMRLLHDSSLEHKDVLSTPSSSKDDNVHPNRQYLPEI